VLSGIGWRAGPAAAAAFGVVVLLTAHIVTPADLASGFQVLWCPFVAIVSIMLTANVARRLGILDNSARASNRARANRLVW
jgi:Na+/H+ antiporter NhaD/arsenite permease-like protein